MKSNLCEKTPLLYPHKRVLGLVVHILSSSVTSSSPEKREFLKIYNGGLTAVARMGSHPRLTDDSVTISALTQHLQVYDDEENKPRMREQTNKPTTESVLFHCNEKIINLLCFCRGI